MDRGDFDAFVRARSRPLLKAAWLLTGDWQLAEDLLQTALVKVYLSWGRIRREGNAEAYARRVLVTTYVTGRRRRWRGEVPTETLPDQPTVHDEVAGADLRRAVTDALRRLPRRQRAVVVLRYYALGGDWTDASGHARAYPELGYPAQDGVRVVRTAPSGIRVQGPGCYGLQVDGSNFSEVITFSVTSAPGS